MDLALLIVEVQGLVQELNLSTTAHTWNKTHVRNA